MKNKTSDMLGIIWNTPEGQIETPGIYVCTYFATNADSFIEAEFANIWPDVLYRINRIDLSETCNGELVIIDVYVTDWPCDEEWTKRLSRTFTNFDYAGSNISWICDEFGSWSSCIPDPAIGKVDDNIYAAYTKATGMLCNSNLSEPLEYLNNDQLKRLDKFIWKRSE